MQLPIIIMLPHDSTHDTIKACMEAGANDCIIKPIRQAELMARLSTYIMLPQLAAADADRAVNLRLLEAMLPPRIIERLKIGSKIIAEQHKQVGKYCMCRDMSNCWLYSGGCLSYGCSTRHQQGSMQCA